MDDSFKVRVDRAFGSLEPPSSSVKSISSSLSSLWCLTDEEIQRNEWIQGKVAPHKDKDENLHRLKNPKPYSSSIQGLLVAKPSTSNQDLDSDIHELDEEDDNQQTQLSKPDDHTNEEWDIRSSVGMDCTLDNEEEEDAYDKVAVGREELANRFYMRAVNDYEVELNSNNEFPNSLTDVIRDPRANHTAAKLRLKEDDESARKLGLQVSQNSIQESFFATESKKQVCFEPGGIGNHEQSRKVMPFVPQEFSSVPDYLQNPSKYTHYTFDSMDEIDEETNDEVNYPTSIIFTPRKKSSDDSVKKSEVHGYEGIQKKVVPISIAAVQDSEICVMDEDQSEIATNKRSSLQKSGRRYRTKGSTHVE